MPISEQEALACLRLVVSMAQIDGKITTEEKVILQDMLNGIRLPKGVSAEVILNEDVNVDNQLKQILSDEAREQAFLAAYSMAFADKECTDEEKNLLKKIQQTLVIPKEKVTFWGRIIGSSRKSILPSKVIPVGEPEKREDAVRGELVRCAVFTAALSEIHMNGMMALSEQAMMGLQIKLIRDIGRFHGYTLDVAEAKDLLGKAGGNATTRMVVRNITRSVPSWWSITGSKDAFATTWAAGMSADAYFQNAKNFNADEIRSLFNEAKSKGEEAYEQNKTKIAGKRSQNETIVKELGVHLAEGRISPEEFELRIGQLA